ncbi:response regulator transcription factor [Agrobacterium rhizogenes]|nr:response regulator transcription factor [Rhizobium rhizogenes]NTJ77763.1 response regulator transcription factor [Rhizobium rhizogenes]
MNPVVLFWSQNLDLYLLFSHILAVEGFSAALLDEEELGKLPARSSVLAIILDTENNPDHVLRICSALKTDRATAHIPLLALMPGGNERHYIDLLKAGVSEGFIRPVSPARILAYLQSLMSGGSHGLEAIRRDRNTFNVWELSLETSHRMVRHGSESVQLGPIEFKLLCRLLQAPGRVFSRAELIEAAWPPNYYVQPRTVDVHVGRLRRTLEQMTGRNIIRTIRSSGYSADFS